MIVKKRKEMTGKLSRSLLNTIKNVYKKKRENDRQRNWTRMYFDDYNSLTSYKYTDGVSIVVLICGGDQEKKRVKLLYYFSLLPMIRCLHACLFLFACLLFLSFFFSVRLHALSHSFSFVRFFVRSLVRCVGKILR